jgi:ECF sigma factor
MIACFFLAAVSLRCKKPPTVLRFAASVACMRTPLPAQREVTQLPGDWGGGDEKALEKLIPLAQPELHRLAHHSMSRERAGHTLQTTAIFNEAYLRPVDSTKPIWQAGAILSRRPRS